EASQAADIASARDKLATHRQSGKSRPIVLFDDSSSSLAAEAAQAFSGDLMGPCFLLARDDDDRPLSRDERVLFTSAIAKSFSDTELAACLNAAIGGAARPRTLTTDTVALRRSLSILIADDNRTNQKVLSKILERGGHRSTIANNGEEAVDMLLTGAFDLVFMDVNMPVMNGIEATKLYRFAALGRDRVPIVALTADATPEARARCEEAGMDGCVTKPIEAAQLFKIIDSLVPVEPANPASTPILDDSVAEISAHPRFRPETRAIDAPTIERLQELGGRSFVVELAEEFIAEGARIIEELKASAASHDSDGFSDRAHALRSGAANIGALKLYELCLALRTMGAVELARDGAEKAREIEAEFARVRLELADFRGREVGAVPQADGVTLQAPSTGASGVIRQLRPPVPTSAGSAQR
ncbi:MAG TPA: response regulator, partial [Propylenella sp.]|nr:response regulator [Propylenella sp.]